MYVPPIAAHRDREIAGRGRPRRSASPAGSCGSAPPGYVDDVMGAGESSGVPGEVVLRALRRSARRPGARRRRPGRVPVRWSTRLRDERDLGVEGLGDVVRERAQEGLADDARGPGRDRPQQVALPGVAPGPGTEFEEGGQGSSRGRKGGSRRW